MRDFKRLRNDPPQGVNGSPNPDNIMLWNAVIFGPEDTPWDGGECLKAPSGEAAQGHGQQRPFRPARAGACAQLLVTAQP